MKNHRLTIFSTILILTLIFGSGNLHGTTITSVILAAVDSPTTLTNGRSYYLAGRNYTFRVQATEPLNTAAADWGTITLNINDNTATSRAQCVIDIATQAATGETNLDVISSPNSSGVFSNIDFLITVRLHWNNPDDFAQNTNTVTATVTDNDSPAVTDTISMAFGMSTHVDVYNFKTNGDAADGRINPDHLAFTVTGSEIIYYVQDLVKSGAADNVRTYATLGSGEITGTTLLYDGAPSAFTDNDETNTIAYNVTAAAFSVMGDHTLSVRVITSTTAISNVETPAANDIDININRVEITGIVFFNGGGITAAPLYYRSVNIPGTQIRITAQLENNSASLGGDRTMRGETSVTVRCIDTASNFTVTILSGGTIGTAIVPTPAVTDGTTDPMVYQVIAITGSAYDNEQDTAGEVTSNPATVTINWDRNDPPGRNGTVAPNYEGNIAGAGNTPFTNWIGWSNTATSLTFTWTSLTALGLPFDGDFYTYRIYYKENAALTWTMVDNTVDGNLGLSATGTFTVPGLDPFTQYDFFITAVDVFGQEVDTTPGTTDAVHSGLATADYDTIITDPLQVDIAITDSITRYANAAFDGEPVPVPLNRPLRNSAIRVDVFWASSQGEPDQMNIIITNVTTGNLVTGGSLLPFIEGTDYDRIQCNKTAPNKWSAFIPSGNRYIITGDSLKFILESVQSGIPSYVDHDSDTDPAELVAGGGNPNDIPWTFSIINPPNFTPWPTRMLNNVITDDNPVAYPSYYLTDDAYVTITAYDIKGRPVAMLLENAWRPAGQNIKEEGWAGTNKNKKKLGVGLYYIRVLAKRASDGKVLIDKYSKIVVAK